MTVLFVRRPWGGLDVRKTGMSTDPKRKYFKHPIFALQHAADPNTGPNPGVIEPTKSKPRQFCHFGALRHIFG